MQSFEEEAIWSSYIEAFSSSSAELKRQVRLGFVGGIAAQSSYKIGDWTGLVAGEERFQVLKQQWPSMKLDPSEIFERYADQCTYVLDKAAEARQIAAQLGLD